ncbi:WXG100 family type VII secretion target [Streptomyces sp. NA04227]|uniref:WXG100 family type VII secretion target n=1 Tax=Streptomyces sp. NA04227 TaxID=2742136 RepID=UPI00158FBDB7|nr:WXG100 family type VII secretion target [Streptomyces sp. NA04227]QKW09515.1 WXG100 family type VII secretion target [Streptomyces sp. NA04227]
MSVPDPGRLTVTYSNLDTAATDLVREARTLETSLDMIQRKVQSLAGLWEGEAFNTYSRQQREWDKEAADIHRALKEIAKVVHGAGGDYRGGDLKAARYYEIM